MTSIPKEYKTSEIKRAYMKAYNTKKKLEKEILGYNKYANGKIYKIVSFKTDKCYIGSTCMTLHERFIRHKCDMQRYKNGKSNYVSSYDIMSYDDANIILVESYSCNTKNELLVREKYWQDKLNCINKNNAIGHDHNASVQKYYNTNKEKISEYKKQHYLKKKQQNITV